MAHCLLIKIISSEAIIGELDRMVAKRIKKWSILLGQITHHILKSLNLTHIS